MQEIDLFTHESLPPRRSSSSSAAEVAPALELPTTLPPSSAVESMLYDADLFGAATAPVAASVLGKRFLVPPFSVLNAREGAWQARKQAWIKLGIASEVGRLENLTDMSASASLGEKDTSIFDPALCEILYRWFCPAAGTVLDPFAGGSVRGIVASILGLSYYGIDLRAEQLLANREQAKQICKRDMPQWAVGDSRKMNDLLVLDTVDVDMVFSCPPYFDLECYSDQPEDLSAMSWEDFCLAYAQIIERSCERLKPNRFAVFVTGDVRDKRGFFRNLPGETVRAFHSAGLSFYNQAILVTVAGSLPLRAGRIFGGGRKLGSSHQYVQVFFKGDPKTIK